ncbi:hypothetical protein Fmac_010442 [Flemingia macrophylla]|uniref:Uncharacterized protein n=1 Tax=Flemingia macrophylla TaxID=520843 RepID=A0ABD1MJK3_9FABA
MNSFGCKQRYFSFLTHGVGDFVPDVTSTQGNSFLSIKIMCSLSLEESSDDDHRRGTALKKGPWTSEEDAILAEYVTKNGIGNWNIVRQRTRLPRCGKSCRLRWTNHLRPDLKKGAFTPQEQSKIIELHALMGNKWAKMAQELLGRTDNEIKNFWNTRLKKRRRVGLPLYPDDIKPFLSNPQSSAPSVYIQHANDSNQASTSSSVPKLVFNNFTFISDNPPLYIHPIYEIPQNNTFEQQQQQQQQGNFDIHQIIHLPEQLHIHDSDKLQPSLKNICGKYYISEGFECSADPSLASKLLPSFQSFDDNYNDMPRQPPDPTETSLVSKVQPQSFIPFDDNTLIRQQLPSTETCYDDPLFYRLPPNNQYLDAIPKIMNGSNHNSMQEELLNSKNKGNLDPTHQDVLYDISRSTNYDNKDENAFKDTLFSIIYPFIPFNFKRRCNNTS